MIDFCARIDNGISDKCSMLETDKHIIVLSVFIYEVEQSSTLD